MKFVLLGPPGAGKGSLATLIRDQLKVVHLSTGDMLREEIKKSSPVGLQAKALMDSGALVSDEIVTRIVQAQLAAIVADKKSFMLDGYPRTVNQAKDLDGILTTLKAPLDFVLNMEADHDLILTRLCGRRVCRKCGEIYHMTNKPSKVQGVCDVCQGELYQRSDDNEATIANRLKVYTTSTQPIIDYYQAQGKVIKLDGNLDTDILLQQFVAMRA